MAGPGAGLALRKDGDGAAAQASLECDLLAVGGVIPMILRRTLGL